MSDRDHAARIGKAPVAHNAEVLPWRDRYSGRVTILCGGLTAQSQPLDRITGEVLGVNASWNRIAYPRTFAHVLSSWQLADAIRGQYEGRFPGMPLFQKTWGGGEAKIWRGAIPLRKRDGEVFRFDLEHGIWTCAAPILTLQLVVYMGFSEVVFVGLDLDHPRTGMVHWWDDAKASPQDQQWALRMYDIQRRALRVCAQALQAERPDVRVLNVSSRTTCDAFPVVAFDAVFPPTSSSSTLTPAPGTS